MTTRMKQIETNLPENVKLCISQEQFRKDLGERIVLGKELLEEEIPSKIPNNYGGMFNTPRYPRKIVYDERVYNDWNNRYKKWNDYNEEYLKSCFDRPDNRYLGEYQRQTCMAFFDVVKEQKENLQRQITKLESFCEKCELFKLADNVVIENVPNEKLVAENENIFIVHGHDGEIKQHVARVLQTLGLKPIILHEQPNEGRTIIEKLEFYGDDASFAIILLTGDDKFEEQADGNAIEIKRARQNVVFEMGYFMAKLGRNRVFIIYDGQAEKIGDIDGVVYTQKENHSWIMSLVKELKAAGFDVDANKALGCI